MPESGPDKPRKGAVGDMTSQRCEGCGEMYSQESAIKHRDCNYSMANFQVTPPAAPPESDRTIVYSESNVEKSTPADVTSARRKAGDPNWPEEVRNAAKEPKNLLNQYILVAQIGKGGMGTVWKAFDRSLLRWVAIKFLTTSDGNEEGVLRFKREAQLAGGLRHPNIAPIYEVGEARGQHFIAMEFIDGASMANAQLPIKDMVDIFIKVALGIEAAHKKGVIHRDLKPQNIMLTSDNWPYVMDFGLAKALRGDSSLSVTGAVMGTPAYMPPEPAQGKLELIDHQSDVYSLGATMYAILSRKAPFQAETAMDILMKVCNEEPIPPRKHNPEIPADVETIILKAMAKKKEDRYPSAGALAEDLKRFLSNEEIEATRPGFMTHIMRKAKRHKSAFIAGGIAVVAILVLAAVVLRPRERESLGGTSGGGGPVEDRPHWMNVLVRPTSRSACKSSGRSRACVPALAIAQPARGAGAHGNRRRDDRLSSSARDRADVPPEHRAVPAPSWPVPHGTVSDHWRRYARATTARRACAADGCPGDVPGFPRSQTTRTSDVRDRSLERCDASNDRAPRGAVHRLRTTHVAGMGEAHVTGYRAGGSGDRNRHHRRFADGCAAAHGMGQRDLAETMASGGAARTHPAGDIGKSPRCDSRVGLDRLAVRRHRRNGGGRPGDG